MFNSFENFLLNNLKSSYSFADNVNCSTLTLIGKYIKRVCFLSSKSSCLRGVSMKESYDGIYIVSITIF